MNTSPGPDNIGYFHLKSAFEANPEFFTKMISNILNNKDFDQSFCKMNIIPIYKSAKKLPPDQPKAFRAVALSLTLVKLTESVFLAKVRNIIESKLKDFQHA
jgi:hypothetical protein